MPADGRSSEVLLRAEVLSARETVVSSARELTPRSVFVVTDWRPRVGTEVLLRISLPTHERAVETHATVVEQRESSGVGTHAGLVFSFQVAAASDQKRLEGLIERIAEGAGRSQRPDQVHRVLLVEDNDFIREMFAYGVAKYFAQRKDKVLLEEAGDAESARRMLEGSGYDLIIVDHYLPAEDGATFIARLRNDPRFAHCPVIAISVGGSEARDATLSAGADLFLDKPVVLRDLFATLQALSQRGAFA